MFGYRESKRKENGVEFTEMGLCKDHNWHNSWWGSWVLCYAPGGSQLQGKDEGEIERVRKGIEEERGVETARGIHVVFLFFSF